MLMMNTKERGHGTRQGFHRLALLALLTIIVLQSGYTESASAASDQITCAPVQGATRIATAKLFIEHNATDEDTGVHGAFDDQGWSELCVYDPNGKQVLAVKPQGQLGDLTMAGIFFESREPPNSEFSIADLMKAFPEGKYEVRGTSFDGTGLTGFATFTHDIPAAPTITFPALAKDAKDAAQALVSSSNLVVSWKRVTETLSGKPITITGYEVIITKNVKDDPNGFSRPTLDVHLSPTQNTLTVPAEFIESNTVYELEVLALEKSGNQTITAGFFKTL
ncbi:MAG: hypothetical protein ACRERX_11695 [Pseudomonas sp.]